MRVGGCQGAAWDRVALVACRTPRRPRHCGGRERQQLQPIGPWPCTLPARPTQPASNAAGTASCLIAGGGNEVGTAPAAPPPGAVPTLSVDSLAELNSILLDTRPGGGSADEARREALLGWRARVPGGEDPSAVAAALMGPDEPGAPAPGLEFADWLIGVGGAAQPAGSLRRARGPGPGAWVAVVAGHGGRAQGLGRCCTPPPATASPQGSSQPKLTVARTHARTHAPHHPAPPPRAPEQMNALCIATTSFPRMGAAAGGLQACPVGGHTVLHLECGAGALTKMLASKGLMVCGADGDVGAAARRGLQCFSWGREGRGVAGALRQGALGDAQKRGPYDVVLFYEPASAGAGLNLGSLLQPSSLAEVRSVLKPGGRLCAEANGADAAAAAGALRAEGWRVDVAEAGPPGRVRIVAQAA